MPEKVILYATQSLLPEGWAEGVVVSLTPAGLIESVERGVASAPSDAQVVDGVLVPGIPNCHSHAFQRAMAGLTEIRHSGDDSFWSWRNTMYRLLRHIGPEELEAISGQLYIEMLKLGYTSVAEFHYLHHGADGKPYADPAEMSHRVIAAARTAGICITHLPVLYCHSDFGALAPEREQLRFVNGICAYQRLWQDLYERYAGEAEVRLGIAPHSLRAVDQLSLNEAIAGLDAVDGNAPIHIHIAEQEREVESCLAYSGRRPVAWLLEHFAVDKRWCLVHATHLDKQERRDLAVSGAVAGLCPSTEANLGDGIFPATDYLGHGGAFAIGSDSQVTLNPVAELRLLEYSQRLQSKRRTLLANQQYPSVGEYLFRGAASGGARALGLPVGAIAAGNRADLLVLDEHHPVFAGGSISTLLDSWIFACDSTPVKDVMVGGRWRVRNAVHPQEQAVARRFSQVMQKIASTG